MADLNTLKGFIKNSSGDIILPISRGELIFDVNGNIALHSPVFKALAASRYTATEILEAAEGDDAYGKTAGDIKEGSGRYGLMKPEDLLDLYEALSRISIIERETGIAGVGGNGESLKQMLMDLIDKVGYYKGEVTGKDEEDEDIIQGSDTGIYLYINNKIIDRLASFDGLRFKGTLGNSGNILELPTENISNGDTYKVITSKRYKVGENEDFTPKEIQVKVGDLVIALYTPGEDGALGSFDWIIVPSGNELETFIKVQLGLGTEAIDKVLSGEVEFTGTGGISVLYNETTNKVVISGAGIIQQIDLTRVVALENTVYGTEALGTPGSEDYVPPTLGLVQKTLQILLRINNAVTTWEEVVEKETDEDGQPTNTLANGDELVKASAVFDVTAKLALHIATAEGKYLSAEIIALNTPLTTALRAYLAGAIVN